MYDAYLDLIKNSLPISVEKRPIGLHAKSLNIKKFNSIHFNISQRESNESVFSILHSIAAEIRINKLGCRPR